MQNKTRKYVGVLDVSSLCCWCFRRNSRCGNIQWATRRCDNGSCNGCFDRVDSFWTVSESYNSWETFTARRFQLRPVDVGVTCISFWRWLDVFREYRSNMKCVRTTCRNHSTNDTKPLLAILTQYVTATSKQLKHHNRH